MTSEDRVFVVDDNDDFRQSVAWMLRGEGYDTVEFMDVHKAINALRIAGRKDIERSCLLLDLRMPQMSGFEFHDALKSAGVNIPVVYMTGHGDIPLAVEAMKKGATTFLEKPLKQEQLIRAIDSAISSGTARNADLFSCQRPATDRDRQAFMEKFDTLTPREKDVLGGMVDGHVNKVIASNLNISVRTVEVHRSRVMKKLGIRTASEAVRLVLMYELGAA